jgi:hypothetical protein
MSESDDTDPIATPQGTQAGTSANPQAATVPSKAPKEIGGPPGPEPTRYGDWQYKGRVTDF